MVSRKFNVSFWRRTKANCCICFFTPNELTFCFLLLQEKQTKTTTMMRCSSIIVMISSIVLSSLSNGAVLANAFKQKIQFGISANVVSQLLSHRVHAFSRADSYYYRCTSASASSSSFISIPSLIHEQQQQQHHHQLSYDQKRFKNYKGGRNLDIRSTTKKSTFLGATKGNVQGRTSKGSANNTNNKINNTNNNNDENNNDKPIRCMKHGMLISSFSDGVLATTATNDDEEDPLSRFSKPKIFLQSILSSMLISDYIQIIQDEIENSAKYSPCAGPNIDYLNLLQEGDTLLERINSSLDKRTTKNKENIVVEFNDHDGSDYDISFIMKEIYNFMEKTQSTFSSSAPPTPTPTMKILYIPTAMYALRSDSNNSPGKQRQRARADGKKRRDKVMQYIYNEIFQSKVNVAGVTLDLDDGSIKQPIVLLPNNHNKVVDKDKDNDPTTTTTLSAATITTTDSRSTTDFPKSGHDAFTKWNPNIVYIEGGNTFWLQHCIEKGDWSKLLIDACCCRDDDVNDDDNNTALYIGSSAGAIVSGQFVETATWKVRVLWSYIYNFLS